MWNRAFDRCGIEHLIATPQRRKFFFSKGSLAEKLCIHLEEGSLVGDENLEWLIRSGAIKLETRFAFLRLLDSRLRLFGPIHSAVSRRVLTIYI